MTKPIYEIRDYTIENEWFDAYKEWAKDIAAPWLKENLGLLISGWMRRAPEVSGSNPIVSPNGQPNVTWIIKWDSRETREKKEFPQQCLPLNGKKYGQNILMKTPTYI